MDDLPLRFEILHALERGHIPPDMKPMELVSAFMLAETDEFVLQLASEYWMQLGMAFFEALDSTSDKLARDGMPASARRWCVPL